MGNGQWAMGLAIGRRQSLRSRGRECPSRCAPASHPYRLFATHYSLLPLATCPLPIAYCLQRNPGTVNMTELKIAVMGAAGRMGRELVRAIVASQGCTVLGGTERPGSPDLGQDLGTLAGLSPLGVNVTGDALELIAKADAILDFTAPKATVEHRRLRRQRAHAFTSSAPRDWRTSTSGDPRRRPPCHDRQVRQHEPRREPAGGAGREGRQGARRRLRHRDPGDAPQAQGRCAVRHRADARQGRRRPAAASRWWTHSVRVRDGHTGARKPGDIGFATLRGGNVVGDHTVIFAGEGERIELTHKAGDRASSPAAPSRPRSGPTASRQGCMV